MTENLYIIDVYSLVFQVFHAIPPMTAPDGRPTNAVFGFTRDLLNIIDQKKPSHLICAIDVGGPGVRNDVYAEYKANRDEMPDDLKPQIPLVREVMQGLRVPVIGHEGWEADDVIATLTRHASDQGLPVVIVSSDKDARQLLSSTTRMFNCRRNAFYDTDNLANDWGIRPDQVIDFQSLVGDSVDNVPGVPLVGPKKAQALLEQFGDLETVLANAADVRGKKLSENLQTYGDQARLSRELVTLRNDLPLDVDLEEARIQDPDTEQLIPLFKDLGFRKFAEQLQQHVPGRAPTVTRRSVTVQTPAALADLLQEMKTQQAVCVQPETATDARTSTLSALGIVFSDDVSYHVPFDDDSFRHTVLTELKRLFSADRPRLVSHDVKRTLWLLKQDGACPAQPGVDPMIGDYLLEAGGREHDAAALSRRYLHRDLLPPPTDEPRQKTMFETDNVRAADHIRRQAEAAWETSVIVGEALAEQELADLYDDLEQPLIRVLHEMEVTGVRVDADELRRQSQELSGRLEMLTAEIHDLAGHEFNIDSPRQLRVVLFDELKLPVVRRTKTGPSTNQDVLERLAPLHPLPARITEQRHLAKLRSTYLDALPELIDPATGRIHATFQQATAATGRLTSTDPNLQNIPIRTPEGRQVRRAFVPQDDWKLVCADYSQIELRVLAHLSQDSELLGAFEDGIDIHTAVASEIFEVPQADVDADMRRVAKAVNFGVIYGQSPWGLAGAIDISQDDAAGFIESYFEKYARVDEYLFEILQETRASGYARTILHRRRPISGIRNTRGRQRNMPERTAINSVIQGSAADLIKRAMINIQNRLHTEDHPGRMLLQIHDELVFEVPLAQQDSLIELVREEMEHAFELTVPLVVDISAGDNWLDAKAL